MSDSDFMGFKARAAGHDNCYYRCATCGAFAHYSEAHACGIYARHEYKDTCGCADCMKRTTKECAERMRAATCKCGHVGAECFDDEYCATESEAVIWERKHRELHQEYTEYRKGMRAEIEAMKAAHKIYITYEHEQVLRALDELNDLQADYAAEYIDLDCQFDDLSHFHNNSTIEQMGRIEELETTIRVLSGMVG